MAPYPPLRSLFCLVRRSRRSLLLWIVLFILGGSLPLAPPADLPTGQGLSPLLAPGVAAANPIAIEPQMGYYSPNTIIEMRGDQLWFVRAPYESQLVPVGDGTFVFTQGWLANRLIYFTHNELGGISIMLMSDGGQWQEFARYGQIYTDLNPAVVAALEQVLDGAAADPNVPGAILHVSVAGQGIWTGARGVSDTQHGIPIVPHDHFRIASITKTFVATVVLQLVEEGYLTLDDTVGQWMPGLIPNGENITLRHLLNHTSGLYNYLDDGFVNMVLEDRGRIWTPREIAMYAAVRPTYFAPGEPGRWHYSNTNYILLGMVIEHATGVSLEQQIYWRILKPLGMEHTHFDPDEARSSPVIRGYVGTRDYTDINLSFAWAAGGMVSTAEDVGRFIRALAAGELLQPQSIQAMHTFDSGYGAWGASNFVYGLGVMQDVLRLEPDVHGQPRPAALGMVRGHTGGLTGYRTAMWHLPESGVTIVVCVNQMYYDPNIIVERAMNTMLSSMGR